MSNEEKDTNEDEKLAIQGLLGMSEKETNFNRTNKGIAAASLLSLRNEADEKNLQEITDILRKTKKKASTYRNKTPLQIRTSDPYAEIRGSNYLRSLRLDTGYNSKNNTIIRPIKNTTTIQNAKFVLNPLKNIKRPGKENEKLIFLTSTRMNPPTPGHLRLIEKLIMSAIDEEVKEIYIVLSKKNDDKKNPIACMSKIKYLNGIDFQEPINSNVIGEYGDCIEDSMVCKLKRKLMSKYPSIAHKILEMNVIFKCVDENQRGPFDKIKEIITEKLNVIKDEETIGIYLIVGEDRADTIENIKNGIKIESHPVGRHPKISSLVSIPLSREASTDVLNLSDDQLKSIDISPTSISGTLIRRLVEKPELNEMFNDIYSDYLSPEKTQRLLNEIKSGIERNKTNKKPTKRNSNPKKGGRRSKKLMRKKKTNKIKKTNKRKTKK